MKRYDEAVEIVAQQIRNIDVAALMKQNKIHLGKDDLPDYLLAQGVFRVLAELYKDEAGVQFLRDVLEEEISISSIKQDAKHTDK